MINNNNTVEQETDSQNFYVHPQQESKESFKRRIDRFRDFLASKRKIFGGVLGVLVLTVSLGTGVYLVQQRQSMKTEAGGVDLSLSSTSGNPKVGDTFIVTVGINSQGASVSAADVKISFDDNLLEAASPIEPGSFLPTVLIPSQISNGIASLVLGCLVDETAAHPQSGTGYLAKITFRAKAAGTTSLSFNSATAVAVIGQGANAVGTMNPVQINITNTSASPTASPTESASPTASPTNSPTNSPTATPTDNPSSSPTSSPTGSPGTKAGDINGDNKVDIIDIGILIDNYGKIPVPNIKADLNMDEKVDIIDIGILIDNYGK